MKGPLKIICTIFLFFSIVTNGQVNLVMNPSFETHTACPNTLDQIYLAVGWSSSGVTPDYFNSCATSTDLGVPHNGIGYQLPYSGNAYVGLIAWADGGLAREIIKSQLSQTLIIGQKYYVTMQVNLAEYQPPPAQFVPCNKIGVRFSTVQSSSLNPSPINNFSHIYSNTIISDTMNWTKIQGSFIADSAYKYITLGNFFDDANTDTTYRPNGVRSYFFIDDVCVSTSSITCGITTDINDREINNFYRIFPNPAANFVSINSTISEETTALIFTPFGEIIFKISFMNNLDIDLSSLENGMFFLQLTSKNRHETKKIVIKK
jgi:hypothetical protein